jgi:rubrerythrin
MATFYSPSEVVGMAVETEKAGRQFYEATAAAARSTPSRDLFVFLAGEEVKHERTYQALYEMIKGSPGELPYDWDEAKQYLKAITESKFFLTPGRALPLARSAKNEVEALEFAIQFEKETLLFYLEIERLVAAEHRAIIKELTAQERIHIRRLSELREKMPGGGQ